MNGIVSHWNSSDWEQQWSSITPNVHPVECVSHNDYWRPAPLFTAISQGCVGVEADVWSFDDDSDIFVGHTRWSLKSKYTLKDLYVEPLVHLLRGRNDLEIQEDIDEVGLGLETSGNQDWDMNGVFETKPSQTLIFLIDFKTSGPKLWEKLNAHLSPLREHGFLTHYGATGLVYRPVTVVVSGEAPFDLLTANQTYRDIFYDAPLEELADGSHDWPNPNLEMDPSRCRQKDGKLNPGCRLLEDAAVHGEISDRPIADLSPEASSESTSNPDTLDPSTANAVTKYDSTNSYYASTSFTHSIGHVRGSRLSQEQLQLIRAQIRGAHQRGLKVRYWGLPQWPRGLRNHVWHILVREGADLINADDLDAARWGDWRRVRQQRSEDGSPQ